MAQAIINRVLCVFLFAATGQHHLKGNELNYNMIHVKEMVLTACNGSNKFSKINSTEMENKLRK